MLVIVMVPLDWPCILSEARYTSSPARRNSHAAAVERTNIVKESFCLASYQEEPNSSLPKLQIGHEYRAVATLSRKRWDGIQNPKIGYRITVRVIVRNY